MKEALRAKRRNAENWGKAIYSCWSQSIFMVNRAGKEICFFSFPLLPQPN